MRLLFFSFISLCILYNRCTLFAFLHDTLMMVAAATETCRRIVICDKIYFIGVHLLVCYLTVNIPQCTNMEHINLLWQFRCINVENSPRYSPTEATGSNRAVGMEWFPASFQMLRILFTSKLRQDRKGSVVSTMFASLLSTLSQAHKLYKSSNEGK